ncbi:MAG TPA: GNAT family N-acetyltransferase [Micromonosporaceae bacterium]
MSLTVVLTKFDAERWQCLDPGSPVQSGPWVRIMLSRLPGDPLMVVLERADGALGFTGAVVSDPGAYEAYNPWAILRRQKPVFGEAHTAGRVPPAIADQAEALLPGVVLVAPGYLGDPVGPLADRPDAVREGLTGVVDWARGEGMSSVSVLYTSLDAAAVVGWAVARLGGATFPLTSRFTLPVSWSHWQEYVADLPKDHRNEPGRQMRRLSEGGCTVTCEAPELAFDDIVAARCELLRWCRQPVDESDERYQLASLIDAFGSDLLLFATRRDGELLSGGLFLAYGRTLLNVYTGTTVQGRQTPFAHLAATYHGPVGFVTQERFDVIDYGVGHGDTKRLQGCQELPMYGHVIPLS